MLIMRRLFILPVVCTLAACVNLPTGPSVMTLPGSGISFDQFRYDDYECREYAYQQVGGRAPQQAAQSSGVESAAIGTGLGAAAGAAFGGGSGAAIGAGTGLLMGGLIGSGTATASGYESQRRYDFSYIQCMYAKGHRVPVSGDISRDQPVNSGVSPRIYPPPPPSTR